MGTPKHVLDAVDKHMADRYYHISQKPLPIGKVLVSEGSAGYTPWLVDKARPGLPRRNDYLFMVKDVDCLQTLQDDTIEGQHVYRVTPMDDVRKTNFGWLQRIRGLQHMTIEQWQAVERRLLSEGFTKEDNYWKSPDGSFSVFVEELLTVEYANNYWSGVPTEPCKDEYLTMAFRVDKE